MNNSNLNLVMVLIGMNIVFGLDALADELYILGTLQLALSVGTFWIFNGNFKTEKSKK